MSFRDIDPDIVKRFAELVDGDTWQTADLLVDVFPVEVFGDADHGTKSSLYKAMQQLHTALLVDYGIDLNVNTMRTYRATALKWPDDARASSASFKVHARLRGDDRVGQMRKYTALAAREDRALSVSMLTRFRADEKPRRVTTMEVKMRRRIESAVKAVLCEGIVKSSLPEQWWTSNRVTAPQRAMAVAELRALADRIEGTAS